MTSVPETSIFTKIINREIPADIIDENESVIAFLTIEPITPGHTLIVSKKPFVNIFDGDVVDLGEMMAMAKRISNALTAAGIADGVNLIMNNGSAAGQEVFHAHLHVVPRHDGDGALRTPAHCTYTPGQAQLLVAQITDNL